MSLLSHPIKAVVNPVRDMLRSVGAHLGLRNPAMPSQSPTLTLAQVAALNPLQIEASTGSQIQYLTTDQITNGLTTTQIPSLTTDELANGLTTAQLAALTTAQISPLTTDGIANGLTTAQVAAQTMTQVSALTTDQLAAMTAPQSAVLLSTPLVLDLNGDGRRTLGASAGVQFDIKGNGQPATTGWVAPGDGFLVWDPSDPTNANALISGKQLFGSAFVMPDGTTARNGYQALASFDSNGDGVISRLDARWDEIKVWVGSDAAGIGVLESLSSLGITQLDLSASPSTLRNNGNAVGLASGYQTRDGATHDMGDVWFRTAAAETNLQARVTGMVQTLSAYSCSTLPDATNGPSLASPLATLAAGNAATASARVANLASLLGRYDANGNLLATAATTVPQVAVGAANWPQPAKTIDSGILTSSGR